MMLKKNEVDADIIKNSKIFHFGTLSSTHDGVRFVTRYAIDIAKNNGGFLFFNPNLREPLWDSPDDARREIEYGLSVCDILKISDNELEFIGADGNCAYYKDISVYAPSFNNVKMIEKRVQATRLPAVC